MKCMKKVLKIVIVTLMVCASISINRIKAVDNEVVANWKNAINQINVPKYDENGNLQADVKLSDALKKRLDNTDLKAKVDVEAETLHVDFDIQGAYLSSDYMNGKTQRAGTSYYNMLNFYADVLQVKQLLDEKNNYTVIDVSGDELTVDQIDKLLVLLEKINLFDSTTNLVYNGSRGNGTDVKATTEDGTVNFTFHIDSHGYWGYELGPKDSITGVVMGEVDDELSSEGKALQREHNSKYANFFVIKMKDYDGGKLYQLNSTDLENPMIYVSNDGKEAFMIDVDFYGSHVLNNVIKSVIGDKCESLKIFITHNHPDHVDNLSVIAQDDKLKKITKIMWPENEKVADSAKLFGELQLVKDGEEFQAAGVDFEFIEIADEHTPGGGQVADLTNDIIHIGDTLGAQVHLGGTTISMSNAQAWLDGAIKTEEKVKEYNIKAFIGGHTPYINTTEYATWMKTAVQYAMDQMKEDASWSGGLTVVENGKVVTPERFKNIMTNGLTDAEELKILSVNFRNDIKVEETTEVTANYEKAVNEIIIPKYDKDGNKLEQKISDTLKSKLNTANIVAVKNSKKKTLAVDFQIKDVYLASDYLNGKDPAGNSYYNMLNFYTNIKQVKQLLDTNNDYKIVDKLGNKINKEYIEELLGLLDQINNFDVNTDLEYDIKSQNGTDVIATSQEGNVSFKFHIDSHGYWGYDLGAHDSITGIVMGYDEKEAMDKQHQLTMQYGNFFVIKMLEDDKGTLYQLNGTDLENPMIYLSKDKKEALMIDVDMYGAHILNKIIKDVIGKECESLKIFLTHMHGDHVNNLATIYQDEELRDIVEIIWPKNEPHAILSDKDTVVKELVGRDLTTLFGEPTYVSDMEKFEAAGFNFQFIEIADEHTPGGGQLADLDNGIIYIGDTLGAQVHLGGTTIGLSNIRPWLDGAVKTEKYAEENKIKYFIGGHTPYLNTPEFATWMRIAIEYAKDEYTKDKDWTGGLTIVENGKIVTPKRFEEIMKNGLTDAQELKVLSVNFRNDIQQQKPGNIDENSTNNPTVNPSESESTQPNKTPKTGDNSTAYIWVILALASVSGLGMLKLRKKGD